MRAQQCVRCFAVKALTDFYRNDRTCKVCRTALVRANRAAKIDYYREYDRSRANDPERVAAREAYLLTPAGKRAKARANKRWNSENERQRRANVALNNAVRDGLVQKQPCLICGSTNVEGHHPHYDLPLDVVWLCVEHHKELHKEHSRDGP